MKKQDFIFAIICGLSVAWVVVDFVPMKYGTPYRMIGFIILPILSVIGLYVVEFIGKKFLFIHQAGKFALAGVFADVVDIKIFQLLIIFAPFSLFFKGVSFLIAVAVKYFANKHWTFPARSASPARQPNGSHGGGHSDAGGEKHEGREVICFFLVTLVGLFINVVAFYCATEIIHPQFGISVNIWIELSIIFAALVTAAWNFLGYKFLVFKK